MADLMSSTDVMYLLKPLPAPTTRQPDFSTRAYPPPSSPVKGGKKGKGGSKGTQPPPGVLPRTSDGKNICFAFNSQSGCGFAKPGKRCNRGYHLCGRK
eukprot:6470075-Amphidinium_carterae.1